MLLLPLLLLNVISSTRETKLMARGVRPDYQDDNSLKLSTESKGPRPDYEDDDPSFRTIGLHKNHNSKRIRRFKEKCINGDLASGEEFKSKTKCTLDGYLFSRLICENGSKGWTTKRTTDNPPSEICKVSKSTFSMRLEHSTRDNAFGTLFVLDHGRHPSMERGSAGTVCLGRGSMRFTDEDKVKLCQDMGYSRAMTEDEVYALNYT